MENINPESGSRRSRCFGSITINILPTLSNNSRRLTSFSTRPVLRKYGTLSRPSRAFTESLDVINYNQKSFSFRGLNFGKKSKNTC